MEKKNPYYILSNMNFWFSLQNYELTLYVDSNELAMEMVFYIQNICKIQVFQAF